MTRNIHISSRAKGVCTRPPVTTASIARLIASKCLRCGKCLAECEFLTRQGFPGKIAEGYPKLGKSVLKASFNCSLCGLCSTFCPEKLPISRLFLELRRWAVAHGVGGGREHLPLQVYEYLGHSSLFTRLVLNPDSDAIFFPGCGLPGILPHETMSLYFYLREKIPGIGILLDCCGKPSHDLGKCKNFERRFGRMRQSLQKKGVRRIITACPSCYQAFKGHAPGVEVSMVYQYLNDGMRTPFSKMEKVVVHDPCTLRNEQKILKQIRSVLASLDVGVEEMSHHGISTYCCGEGGGVSHLPSQGATSWREKRLQEMGDNVVITSCAGCTGMLKPGKTLHLVGLLFSRSEGGESQIPGSSLVRYINRLWFKWKISRHRRSRQA